MWTALAICAIVLGTSASIVLHKFLVMHYGGTDFCTAFET